MYNIESQIYDYAEHKPKSRHRGISERSKSLLFLLREVPYITMKDIHRFFYPTNKNNAYAKEMVRVLTKNKLLHCSLLGIGFHVYYLSGYGRRVVDFFLQDNPKYFAKTRSFYYAVPPHKISEVNPFFFFPDKNLEFKLFTPHNISTNPFYHVFSFGILFLTEECLSVYVCDLDGSCAQ